ncbi:hypothetical protein TNCV_2818521 [Trichonephila clavipes]|nr:hypothetical protein TNCV_2818521 [Trichonephila clavipes]
MSYTRCSGLSDSEGIQRLVWPASSPDLNPIENVWDALGRQVVGRNYPLTNKNTLISALTEEWDNLPQQLLHNVVQSMITARVLVWPTPSGTFHVDCLVPIVEQGGSYVIGCSAVHFLGFVPFVANTIEEFSRIILTVYASDSLLGERPIFEDDNAPVHTFRCVQTL